MNVHSTVARGIIVVASLWTAGLQLLSPSSLAYRAAGASGIIDVVNVVVLALAALAGADVLWNDIFRRGLIWPSFPERARHHVCVWVYSLLAAAFGIRAFIAAGDASIVLQVGAYYVLLAAFIAAEAYAIADEKREPTCRTPSDNV